MGVSQHQGKAWFPRLKNFAMWILCDLREVNCSKPVGMGLKDNQCYFCRHCEALSYFNRIVLMITGLSIVALNLLMLSYVAKISGTLKVVNHYVSTTKHDVLNVGGKLSVYPVNGSLGPMHLHMEWARFSGELGNMMKHKNI